MAVAKEKAINTLHTAVRLCKLINTFISEYHAHVALTGGCLYSITEEPRKDIDLVIYRRGSCKEPVDWDGIETALNAMHIVILEDFGYVKKAIWRDVEFDTVRAIDILWPEHPRSDDDAKYVEHEIQSDMNEDFNEVFNEPVEFKPFLRLKSGD